MTLSRTTPGNSPGPGTRPGSMDSTTARTEAGRATPMALEITPEVTIPDSDLTYAFVRASGPGGQNVNKVSSAVQLRFDMEGSTALSEPVKNRLGVLAGRPTDTRRGILIIARNQRSQEHNRREALASGSRISCNGRSWSRRRAGRRNQRVHRKSGGWKVRPASSRRRSDAARCDGTTESRREWRRSGAGLG